MGHKLDSDMNHALFFLSRPCVGIVCLFDIGFCVGCMSAASLCLDDVCVAVNVFFCRLTCVHCVDFFLGCVLQ